MAKQESGDSSNTPLENGAESSVASDTGEALQPSARAGQPPTPPDVEQARERTRGLIALGLISLLAAIVLLAFLGMLIGRLAVRDLKELLIFLGPLIAPVGAAVAFYFGGARR